MGERIKITDNSKEQPNNQTVGFRLQDVVLRLNVRDGAVLKVRESYLKRGASDFDSERIAVLNALSENVFGESLDHTLNKARRTLKPFSAKGHHSKSLIISSATSSSGSQESEIDFREKHGHPIDIPGAIEGRDTRSSKKGDVALISTHPGLVMARAKGDVKIINLADENVVSTDTKILTGADIYYKADGLLLLILTNPKSKVLTDLRNEMAGGAVVYPYNLDEETQLCLLWLAKTGNISEVKVNANSPDVAVNLTRKSFKYPSVEDALTVKRVSDPHTMQINEWKLSSAAKEVNFHPDFMPGYFISRGNDIGLFKAKAISALMLMSSRYGFNSAWSKPDRGTDGGNQELIQISPISNSVMEGINMALDSGNIEAALEVYIQSQQMPALNSRIEKMWSVGGDWVLEATTNYFNIPFAVDGKIVQLRTAPSVHLIDGEPRKTISLQILDGQAWGGNFICSEENWKELVMLINDKRFTQSPKLRSEIADAYAEMTSKISGYTKAINSSAKYRDGQVRGGADLAIATLGGRFGNELVVGVQDYNARANGCETAYSLYDYAKEQYGSKGEAVTRNISPLHDFNYFQENIGQVIKNVNGRHNLNIQPSQIKIIAVSSGWGQYGVIGSDGLMVLKNVFLVEDEMRRLGLIT